MGRHEDVAALRDFERALSLDRKNPFAYLGRGVIRISKADYDGAIADLSQTIKLKPDFAAAYKVRSRAWDAKGNRKRAEADRKKARSLGAN
jgi:tetratricopeptide (TPR) repeat protein